MWRTESKLALVAIALIVLGGIYGMSNKSNNRKADAIAVLMENGEVDSYNNVLFYTANDEQMDQRTLSALSYLSRGYDMVQVYNKMSDYNDKELWSANKPSWDTVYQTPKEVYQYAYNRECGWRYQGRLEKMVGLRLNHLFKSSRVGLSCVHATVH
jgi:hypothetical protein